MQLWPLTAVVLRRCLVLFLVLVIFRLSLALCVSMLKWHRVAVLVLTSARTAACAALAVDCRCSAPLSGALPRPRDLSPQLGTLRVSAEMALGGCSGVDCRCSEPFAPIALESGISQRMYISD